MWLVKAYKGNEQLAEAIALCQQLTTSEQQVLQIWAKQFILTLVPLEALQKETETQEDTQSPNASDLITTTTEKAADVGIKMKTLSELKVFYQRNFLHDLKAIEVKRQQIIQQLTVVGITILLLISLLLKFFPTTALNFSSLRAAKSSFFILFVFLFAFVACMWFWVAFYSSSTETYAKSFKTNIIQKLIDFIDSNKTFSYCQYAEPHTTLTAFKHSQLFQSIIAPSKISQNNCITGRVGETDVFFSEICVEIEVTHQWLKNLGFRQYTNIWNRHLFNRTPIYVYVFLLFVAIFKGVPYVVRRMIKGQRIDYYHFEEEVLKNEVSRKSVFKGLFFQADFNKQFKGKTVVLPGVLDYKVQPLNRVRGQVIRLEDAEFAKFFIVYGDDQVEARYILSTSLIAKLVKFRKKARRNIYVSFVESRIYIAIEYAEDLFEPKLFKNMLSFTPIQEYFETLQLMISVVEELNLNRRIWSKK